MTHCLQTSDNKSTQRPNFRTANSNLYVLCRISFEHRYLLASTSPSAGNRSAGVRFPVQFIALMHQ